MTELSDWEVLRAETVLDQPPWLTVVRQDVRLPGGAVIRDYLLAQARDFSMVAAVTDQGEALLVRQYKHGAGRPLIDFPAGYLEEGEDPLDCARRELLEETGHRAREWTPLGAFLLDPNRSSNRVHYFLARGLEQVAGLTLDETENLHAFRRPWAEVAGLLRPGQMDGLASGAAWGLANARLAEMESHGRR